jgi:diguanylate cyclase (GGDEF)-like protein
VLLILCSCVTLPLLAAPWNSYSGVQPRFESVGAGAIPRGVVPAFVQDRQGFFWIATGDGLVRFDGYEFRPQERQGASLHQRNLGWIRALLAGHDGRVWIGTESDGLAAYDPVTDSVQDYGSSNYPAHPDPSVARPPKPPAIRALAEDARGRIYVGSVGGGLQVFDPQSGRFTGYKHSEQQSSLPDDRIQALLVDRQQTLWIGSWSGLVRRPSNSDHFETIDSTRRTLSGQVVQAIFEASDGRIWVGTQEGLLVIFDPVTGLSTHPSSGTHDLDRAPVTSFVETPDHALWVGRSGGVQIFDAHSARLLQQMQHDVRRPAGLAGDDVTQLLLDKSGWIWISGFGLGLQRHNPANKSIALREADPDIASPLNKPDVRSLLELNDGEVLVATHDGNVALLDHSLRVNSRIAHTGGAVQSMVQMEDGTVWMGSDSHISAYDTKHRPLRQLVHSGGQTRRMFKSHDGTLWLGTQNGVYQLAPSGRTLKHLSDAGGNPSGEIHAFAEAPDHSVWIGSTVGLYRVPQGSQSIEPVPTRPDEGLGSDIIIGLLFDHTGRLWVDTGVAGLHRMQTWGPEGASFDRVSERHGRSGKPFGANLLEDGSGRIWSQMGVYDPEHDRLTELTSADGADLGTGWFFSYTKRHDGSFLFGGSKGILIVQPEAFNASGYAPPLQLSEMRINGERRPLGQTDRGPVLSASDRSVSVEFTALDFADPLRLEYEYRLDPFDPNWIHTSANMRVASYSNLGPGDYLLRIRATNRSGIWNPVEKTLSIHVAPAWWQQAWMRAIFAAVLVLLTAAIVALRTRGLRRTQMELEEKVRERTAALESMALTLQDQQHALEEASVRDPLTGLHNRRYLTQCIDADVALSLRAHQPQRSYGAMLNGTQDLLFFLFDIDHFKNINDRFSHKAGDEVLRQFSARLKAVFRDTDYVIRWGGEEFLCVARQTDRKTSAELAERACTAVANQPFVLDDATRISITCSVGFTCFPLEASSAHQLGWGDMVYLADAAMYAVKHRGRNGWLGLLGCKALPQAELIQWIHRPLPEWMASGLVETKQSDSLTHALTDS